MKEDLEPLYLHQVAVVLREPVALVTPSVFNSKNEKDVLSLEKVLGLTGTLRYDCDSFVRLTDVTCYYIIPDNPSNTKAENMFIRKCMYVSKKDISLILDNPQE